MLQQYPVIRPDIRYPAGYPVNADDLAGYQISGIINQPDIRYTAKMCLPTLTNYNIVLFN